MTELTTVQYSPQQGFYDKNGPCEILHLLSNVPVANDQALIAAVTGKRSRVIGGNIYSNAAATGLVFKSATAATEPRCAFHIPANTVATPNVFLPWNPYGYFQSNVGGLIYTDNSAVVAITSLIYFYWSP